MNTMRFRGPSPEPWRKFPATMPFGAHKGKSFRDIPQDYLEWAHTVARTDGLKLAISEELDRRGRLVDHGFGRPGRI